MDDIDTFTKYSEPSHRYFKNAQKSLEEGDLDKASEFLWGCVAQAVKALAAKRGLTLRTHGDLWEFMRELATEVNDSTLYEDFRTANYLHSNFYEVELGPYEVLSAAEQVKRLITRLFEIADTMK